MHDWMKVVRTPPAYKVGNSTIRLQTQFVAFVLMISTSVLVVLFLLLPSHSNRQCLDGSFRPLYTGDAHYNAVYPLSPSIRLKSATKYRIGIISDLDTDSKSSNEKNTWTSVFLKGHITVNDNLDIIKLEWDPKEIVLKSSIAEGGRGMELSELIAFNGRLYTIDDRTGIIYEIEGEHVIPWVILNDGNGRVNKGFKGEWATVKDRHLYIGGLGKEWTTTSGVLVNLDPQWIKTVGPQGNVEHHDWHNKYIAMKTKAGIYGPGYMIHESGVWSDIQKKWFFLPRRASKEMYNDKEDEHRATNMLIVCDDSFNDIQIKRIGALNPTRGFSSFKFIPGTNDQLIIALKSEEDNGKIASYILVFDIDGKIIFEESKIGNYKFEGIEFI